MIKMTNKIIIPIIALYTLSVVYPAIACPYYPIDPICMVQTLLSQIFGSPQMEPHPVIEINDNGYVPPIYVNTANAANSKSSARPTSQQVLTTRI
ncbi:hypothetical protein KGM_201977 [Danaus plexippus plexippus]|uniref:Uncharacterized protein n=1 Tax=Danaus plexippus plexippus TaxID=278856 RepID=A0A212EL15_DANPL|nr:hypothetical protein KGM_201977 [Danaus plexippus plexippus]